MRASSAGWRAAVALSRAWIRFERSTTPASTLGGYAQPQPASSPGVSSSASTLPSSASQASTRRLISANASSSTSNQLKSPLKQTVGAGASAHVSARAIASIASSAGTLP